MIKVLISDITHQFADETHHRDVNHTFADLKAEDPSPFVGQHRENTIRALQLERDGETAWPGQIK